MSELEDKISSLLNNPGEMSKFMAMARSIMDGGGAPVSENKGENADSGGGFDPMIQKFIGALGRQKEQKGNTAMLHAISPYLEKERGKKLERAIRLAQMAKVARMVFTEHGGDGLGDE
ncbi:MAG: hypothetical protein AB7D36_02815 [Oscillospiraceae bacterium]